MLISIAANQTAGLGTVIGFGLLILWALGAAAYFTILGIRERPQRRAAAEGNARVAAIKAKKRAEDEKRLQEFFAAQRLRSGSK